MYDEAPIMSEGIDLIADNVRYDLDDIENMSNGSLRFAPFWDETIYYNTTDNEQHPIDNSQVKSVVLYQQDASGARYAYLAKNVSKLPDADKCQSWYIYPVFNA
jgi:hypothetical protein